MIISKAGMEILSHNIGRGSCKFFGNVDFTISRCAWRNGIYLANYEQMRPTVKRASSLVSSPNRGEFPDQELCSLTLSVHYMDARYRSRWLECDLLQKYAES